MDEFKFDELKKFSVPESWLNKALEIPSKKPKAAPKFKFYRYAAAIAACVVIAAAVTLTVMFGFNHPLKSGSQLQALSLPKIKQILLKTVTVKNKFQKQPNQKINPRKARRNLKTPKKPNL